MNTSFRFEQPWFLLLLALLPLLWFIGKRLQKPPVIRFAAARIFAKTTTFQAFLDEGYPERTLLRRLFMPDSLPRPAAVWHLREPRADERYRYHAFA